MLVVTLKRPNVERRMNMEEMKLIDDKKQRKTFNKAFGKLDKAIKRMKKSERGALYDWVSSSGAVTTILLSTISEYPLPRRFDDPPPAASESDSQANRPNA